MTRPQIELVAPPLPSVAARQPASRSFGVVVTGMALLALALVGSWATDRQLDRFLDDLDAQTLHGSEQVFARFIEQQRNHLLSEVAVLVDDTRIRSTVIAAKFDEATVRDVLDDLRKAAGSNTLAVLDPTGKVKVVTGADGLRGADISSSPVVKAATTGPASDVWTFPEQVLVVGIAPVRAADQLAALLMMGFAIDRPVLSAVERASGAYGGIFVGEKMLAGSSGASDPAIAQALRQMSVIKDGMDQLVTVAGREYLGRVVRTNDALTAAKAVWLVPRHHNGGRLGFLRAIVWMPAVAVALTLALVALFRRRNT